MAANDIINDVKDSLKEMRRKSIFKKKNIARDEQVQLQTNLARCRGKLEMSIRDFERAIKVQSKSVREGIRDGRDTVLQEQMLWDAAIGYMLVDDAIYALKTISTYDGIDKAYDLLETASKQMSGKGSKLRNIKGHGEYSYVTSGDSLKDKEAQLSSFFEELKETGDIKACLENMRNPGKTAEKLGGTEEELPSSDDIARYAEFLKGASEGDDKALDDFDLDSMRKL